MYLSPLEERMLSGEYGEAAALAMRILVKVGETLGADRLIPVRHVHVSGVSYSNIGEPGLEFIRNLMGRGARIRVYTTVNPGCVDLGGASRIIDQGLLPMQRAINKVLEGSGAVPVYTCIPYFIRRPVPGEHLAWGESNAVAMANSFYGAYTNREGGPLTLAAAITGRTYRWGLHILENRVARISVSAEWSRGRGDLYGSLIGLYIGENASSIPFITKNSVPENYIGIKEMLASSAAAGSHALVVMEDITPAKTYVLGIEERMGIDEQELMAYYEEKSGPPELNGRTLIYLGCPHLSLSEVITVTRYVARRGGVRRDVDVLLTLPYVYRGVIDEELLRSRGIDIAYGTCPVVSRFRERYDVVLTNSGKAFFYLKKIHRVDVRLGSMYGLLRMVMNK